MQTIWQGALHDDAVQRGGQGGHLGHVVGYALQTVVGEQQPVVEGVGAVHACQVKGIGCQQGVVTLCNAAGHGQEYLVALVVGQTCHLPGSLSGSLEKFF